MPTDYLRNRPFLAVTLTQRPAPNVNTRLKGWQNQPGAIQTFEKVSFVDRINNKAQYAVIIDIINSTVIQNKGTASENEVLATYLGKYTEEVKQALTVWAHREARGMAKEESKV
jgi:hypothetical protein